MGENSSSEGGQNHNNNFENTSNQLSQDMESSQRLNKFESQGAESSSYPASLSNPIQNQIFSYLPNQV